MSTPAAARLIARARGVWRRSVLVRSLFAALAAAALVLAALLVLDLVLPLPAAARRVLRPFPLLAALVPLLLALRRLHPAPSNRRVALLVEERYPELEMLLSTALEAPGEGVVSRAFQARAEARLDSVDLSRFAPLRLQGRTAVLVAGVLSTALVCALAPGGAPGIWARWARLESAAPRQAVAAAGSIAPGGSAASVVADPAFGVLSLTVEPPAYTARPAWGWSGEEVVAALPGSRVRIQGALPTGVERVAARVVGGAELPVRAEGEGGGWAAGWTLAPGERGLSLEAVAGGDTVARRVIPIALHTDQPPVVELLEPEQDVVAATASGELRIRALARDDYGVAELHLTWIRSRGSGESFSFEEGEWSWTRLGGEGGRREGEYRLDLAGAGLEPGDVLHVRAIARDHNTVTGPGEGVSRTRVIRIARPEEMAEATTLVGFPIDPEREPVLSQRMIILLTERLLATAPKLGRDSLVVEAARIADEQARLRKQVGDQALAPTTGGGDDHAGDHDHDADPVLAVNRSLLTAYNAMWSAEGELRMAALTASLPHQHEALRILQELRQAERVFVRGRQRVAPVDVAGVRGTGKLEDAAPAPRTGGPPAPAVTALAAEFEEVLARLPRLDPRPASLALSALAARLLADGNTEPGVAALIARAAEAAGRGEREEGVRLLLRARALLAPGGSGGQGLPVPAAVDPRSARYFRALGTHEPE